nr:retrovirus-related Pol polyprotein from transposon TNT 1-94 [Tanacetum cinerariifolium]
MFTKEEKSPTKIVLEVTSSIESECISQEPLHHLPKLLGAQPIGLSNDVIPSTELFHTSKVSDKTKVVTEKESLVKVTKKKTQTKSPFVLNPCPNKKVNSSTEKLLTLIEEVKGLKEEIKPSSNNFVSVSQTRSSKYSKDLGLKVVFRDNSSGDTKGYGLVNCDGITFTRVSYVNGLKHTLICINQLCDANFKVLFTKT